MIISGILDKNAVACSRCLMQQMMNLDRDLHEEPQASVGGRRRISLETTSKFLCQSIPIKQRL